MPWMVPYDHLDSEQRAFLDEWTSNPKANYWLKGFAGSGKSVLLVHAIIQARKLNPKFKVCAVSYTRALLNMLKSGIPDELNHIPVVTQNRFQALTSNFDAVFVDEVQDITSSALHSMDRSAKRVLIAGDTDQSIYDHVADPDETRRIIKAREYRLNILHRMPPRLVEIAKAIFPEKRLHQAKNGRLVNVDPVITAYADRDLEVCHTWRTATQAASPGKPSAILLPKRKLIAAFADDVLKFLGLPVWPPTQDGYRKLDFGAMNKHIASLGVPLRYLGSGYGSLADGESTRLTYLMTYHSAKGLDFETVLLPRLDHDLSIWKSDEQRERTLLYVALTRTRRNLFISHSSRPHRLIAQIPDNLAKRARVDEDCVEEDVTDDDDDFIF